MTYKHSFNDLFQDNLGKSTPERYKPLSKWLLDFNEARDDGVAMASVEPYVTHLHFTANR